MNNNHLCIGGGIAPPAHPRLLTILVALFYQLSPITTSLSKASSQDLSRRRHQLIWTGSYNLFLWQSFEVDSTQGIARSQAFQAPGR